MRARVIIGIVIGLLAIYWLVVPNRVHRRVSPYNSCINNLRTLDNAKQQLELENKVPLGTIVEPEQIEKFLGRGDNKGVFPKCPAGGAYTLNPIGQLPTCSIKDHVLVP